MLLISAQIPSDHTDCQTMASEEPSQVPEEEKSPSAVR